MRGGLFDIPMTTCTYGKHSDVCKSTTDNYLPVLVSTNKARSCKSCNIRSSRVILMKAVLPCGVLIGEMIWIYVTSTAVKNKTFFLFHCRSKSKVKANLKSYYYCRVIISFQDSETYLEVCGSVNSNITKSQSWIIH